MTSRQDATANRPDDAPADGGPLLALDAASPVISAAVGRLAGTPGDPGRRCRLLAGADAAVDRSSEQLLRLIDRVLNEAGVRPAELAGVVALRGPGSFTGLRVGLATAFGLAQALALPALAVSTLEALAAAAAPGDGGPTVAAVDAIRDEWFVQSFEHGQDAAGLPSPLDEPHRIATAELGSLAPARLVAFGANELADRLGRPDGLEPVEPAPLATAALRLAAGRSRWDRRLLTRPLYLRAPAVNLRAPAVTVARRSGSNAGS